MWSSFVYWFLWLVFLGTMGIIEKANHGALDFVKSLLPIMPYLVIGFLIVTLLIEIILLKRLRDHGCEPEYTVRSVLSYIVFVITFILMIGGLVYTIQREIVGDFIFTVLLVCGIWLYWVVGGWIKSNMTEKEKPSLAFAGNIIVGLLIVFFYVIVPAHYNKSIINSFMDMMRFSA